MKKFFGCAALVCAMLLVFGCEDPSAADTSGSNGTSGNGSSSYTFHYDVDVPTVTLPTLPASSGSNVFAGTTVVNHEASALVFGTDGTVSLSSGLKYTSGSIVPGDATEIYEYSYDSTHLYMRYKTMLYSGLVSEQEERWVTPQEYVYLYAVDADSYFATEADAQERYQENKAERDAESGGSTYEEYAAYVINDNLEEYKEKFEALKTYTVSNGVIQYQYTVSQQQVTAYYTAFLSSDADTLKGHTYEVSSGSFQLVFGTDGKITEKHNGKVYATYAYKLNSNYIYMAYLTHADIDMDA
ncbi:MAG: hypothetical protein K5839_03680, partial [Treponemataceae bacterium]|nr:hypothetical protein [Treponemataceae bacterium]